MAEPTRKARPAAALALTLAGMLMLGLATHQAVGRTGWLSAGELSGDVSKAVAPPPPGSPLDLARQRGVLRVGVREYPRPAPPDQPLPPEPDGYDLALARDIAARLGVQLEAIGLSGAARHEALASGRIDLLLAGADGVAAPAAPQPYDAEPAAAVVLRGSALARWTSLRGQRVCIAQDSPHTTPLRVRHGVDLKTYRSSVHAVYAFMAGDCAALVDEARVIERLMQQDEWRFYRRLPDTLAASDEARPRLAAATAAATADAATDAASTRHLGELLRAWTADGGAARAAEARAANVAFESLQLQAGAICH